MNSLPGHFLLILLILESCSAFLYEPGETVFPSLKIPVSARSQALGGAGVAGVGDGASATLNPAGLRWVGQDQVTLEHINFYQNTSIEFVSAVLVYPGVKIGVAMQYFDLGWGPVTREEAEGSDYSEDNAFAAFDAVGMVTAQFKVKSMDVGITLKGLHEEIWYYGSNGLALDLGVIHAGLAENLTLGASVMNLGRMSAFDKEQFPLTSIFRAGGSYSYELGSGVMLTGMGDVDLANDKTASLPLGLEAAWEYFSLRAGYALFHDTRSFSLGAGVEFGNFLLDYTFIHFTEELNANGRPHFFQLAIQI